MRKKFWLILLALVSALCLVFGLAACNFGDLFGNQNGQENSNGGNNSEQGGSQTGSETGSGSGSETGTQTGKLPEENFDKIWRAAFDKKNFENFKMTGTESLKDLGSTKNTAFVLTAIRANGLDYITQIQKEGGPDGEDISYEIYADGVHEYMRTNLDNEWMGWKWEKPVILGSLDEMFYGAAEHSADFSYDEKKGYVWETTIEEEGKEGNISLRFLFKDNKISHLEHDRVETTDDGTAEFHYSFDFTYGGQKVTLPDPLPEADGEPPFMSAVTHIYVESVEFVENTIYLFMPDESDPPERDVSIEVNIYPLKANNRELGFTSEDENVVTVDDSGVVKAVYYGETYINVYSKENPNATDRCKVVVTDEHVHALSINKEGIETDLYEGETVNLTVSSFPKEAMNRAVRWTSSDEDILRVSANGTVRAVGAGEVTVTATSDDNPEFDFPEVRPYPAEVADDVEITYSSSDPTIATVDENGHITFSKAGKVTITVKGTDFGDQIVERSIGYTSTDGYYLAPLFLRQSYTVNYADYSNGETPLPIDFAPQLEGAYRGFISAIFTIDGEEMNDILRVDSSDGSDIKFYFIGEMPEGKNTIRVTVRAQAYNMETDEIETVEDDFDLIVRSDATGA